MYLDFKENIEYVSTLSLECGNFVVFSTTVYYKVHYLQLALCSKVKLFSILPLAFNIRHVIRHYLS